MRKIYVSVLALMIGAIGFAQSNKSTVTQLGEKGVSNVEQVGGGLNQAIQYQRTPEGDKPAKVDISQNGRGNYANQQQEAHWDGSSQLTGVAAPDYQVFVENRGKNNQAKIIQVGDNNKAWQQQRWDNEDAVAEQRGNRNESRQYQKGSQNIANVNQSGDDHKATQYQYGQRIEAYIVQSNGSNTATQTQDVGGFDEYALAEQSGRNNYSTQTQKGKGLSPGLETSNLVKVFQSGDRNIAIQDQSNDGANGQRNDARIVQRGDDGWAKQDQYGENGIQKIEQRNGNNNDGYQYQDVDSALGVANLLQQNGSNNWSQQLQYGESNMSNVEQNGGNNWSKVTQKGSGNSNTVTQTNP